MTVPVSSYFQDAVVPRRIGTAHPSVVPYQSFATSDGNIFIAAANQNLWERLCRTLGMEALLADARFASNAARVQHRDELLPVLKEAIARRRTAELLEPLRSAGVPCAPVNTLADMLADAQPNAIGALAELDDPELGHVRLANLPFFLDGVQGQVRHRAPRLGEHTREVLAGLGYDDARIETLMAQGAVDGD
jgi:crotonobetainyl-CoA:carnitine CoA-transferase CaiB-like acyl-CoA transferase